MNQKLCNEVIEVNVELHDQVRLLNRDNENLLKERKTWKRRTLFCLAIIVISLL